jgi:hypothetical protein
LDAQALFELAGLEERGGEEAALREQLEQVVALEEAIPLEIKEMQELLEVETEARRREEQGMFLVHQLLKQADKGIGLWCIPTNSRTAATTMD